MSSQSESRPHPWLALVLLTILAGVLRFTAIDRPALWGDEAASWRRVSGTWQQLTDELRTAGFQPAHYVLTWWIKEGFPLRYTRAAESAEDARSAPPRGRRGGEPLVIGGGPRDVVVPQSRLVDAKIDPSPLVMRFLPALCGTLMVPAMYFLASQLVARRTALLVALFTCCSAYQLGYSRDAKMYAQLWFFATLHVGCLLWWLRAYRTPARDEPPPRPEFPKQAELGEGVAGVLPGRHVGQIARAFVDDARIDRRPRAVVPQWPTRLDVLLRWACWVTTGLAMIAFHAVGLGILGIEVLIFLVTMPLRVGAMRRTLVAIASPVLLVVDLVRDRSAPGPPTPPAFADDDAFEEDEEVALPYAVAMPDERLPAPRALARRESVAARPPTLDYGSQRSPSGRFIARLGGFTVPPIVGLLIGIVAVGSLWWSYREFTRFYDRVSDTSSSVQFDVNDAGIDWVEPYNTGRTGASHALANATAYLLSWEWPKAEWVPLVEPRAFTYLSWTATILLTAIAAGLVPWRFALARLTRRRPRKPRRRWRDGDEPTLESISQRPPAIVVDDGARDRGPMPILALLIVAAWLLVPAYAFYTASGAWSADGRRTRAVSPTQAIVNLVYPQAYNDDAKLLAGGASVDVANAKANDEPWPEVRERLARRHWGELFVVRGIDWRQPRWPWLWPLIGVGAIVLVFSRRATWRTRLGWAAGGTLALAALWLLLLVTYAATPVQPRSVWMPRYLGFVWPAFAIAVCTLLRRLPLAPLRWALVALLLASNLCVFAARVKFGEPPVPQQAEDYARVMREPATRMFVLQQLGRLQFGGPGVGTLLTLPGAYYGSRATGVEVSPREALMFAQSIISQRAERVRDAAQIVTRVRRDVAATSLIVWAEVSPDTAEGAIAKQLADVLGPTWRPSGEPSRTTCYDHWTWRRYYVIERHAFTRATPTTAPAAVPVARPAAPRPAVVAPTTRAIVPASRPATTSRAASTTAPTSRPAPASRAAPTTTRPATTRAAEPVG